MVLLQAYQSSTVLLLRTFLMMLRKGSYNESALTSRISINGDFFLGDLHLFARNLGTNDISWCIEFRRKIDLTSFLDFS